MDNPLKTIISNGNASMPNTIILNNYSIQNKIISSPNKNSYEDILFYTDNYFKINQFQNSFSPSPKKSYIKPNLEINFEHEFCKNIIPKIPNENIIKLSYINTEESSNSYKNISNHLFPNILKILKRKM